MRWIQKHSVLNFQYTTQCNMLTKCYVVHQVHIRVQMCIICHVLSAVYLSATAVIATLYNNLCYSPLNYLFAGLFTWKNIPQFRKSSFLLFMYTTASPTKAFIVFLNRRTLTFSVVKHFNFPILSELFDVVTSSSVSVPLAKVVSDCSFVRPFPWFFYTLSAFNIICQF